MRSRLAQMRRGHHRLQRRLDRALGIGEEGGDAGQGLIRLGVEDMQDGADQQRVAGLLPMVAALQRAFGIDQHVGDVLHIADFPFAAAHLEQRIIGGDAELVGSNSSTRPCTCAEARGQRPVLALDVMNDGRARPGQQRGDDKADALAGPRGREAEHMLRTIMAEIVAIQLSEHDAVRPEQPRALDLHRRRPAGRTIGLDVLRLAGAPDGHADGDRDRDEAAGRGDVGALDEDRRRIGVIGVPPPEEGGREIDRHATRQLEPGLTEFGLEAEPPRRPLRRGPDREEHDQEDDDDLAPEDFGGGQVRFPRQQMPSRSAGCSAKYKMLRQSSRWSAAVAYKNRCQRKQLAQPGKLLPLFGIIRPIACCLGHRRIDFSQTRGDHTHLRRAQVQDR